jgi:predicted transcriptional regulator
MSEAKRNDKSALKQLRQERAAFVEKAREKIKIQNKELKAIKAQITTESKTVPEIATATGMLTDRVMKYISTLRKYGQVIESDKDGDYFRYQLS